MKKSASILKINWTFYNISLFVLNWTLLSSIYFPNVNSESELLNHEDAGEVEAR